MRYFVATISPKFPRNYDQCKALGLWGMTRKLADAELVRPSDKILFYLGGVGFVSVAEAQEKLRELSGNDWKPYDPRNFDWGFKVDFTEEFKRPRKYKFPSGHNPEIKIKTSSLQFKGFFRIEEWQYKKILEGEGLDYMV